jgi:hypothetical protein
MADTSLGAAEVPRAEAEAPLAEHGATRDPLNLA